MSERVATTLRRRSRGTPTRITESEPDTEPVAYTQTFIERAKAGTLAEVSHGELEAQVLDLLWSADEAMTPGDVQTALAARRRSLAYTTVMTVLTRLWNKGIVDREPIGRAFAYRPVLSREDTAAQHMSELLEAAGDRAVALSRFVDTIGPREKAQLRRLLTPRKRR